MLILCGCSSQPPPAFEREPEVEGPDCTLEGDERFFPIAEGSTWRYRITRLKSGETSEKMHEVGALQDIGGELAGTMALPVTSSKDSGDTITWQEDTGTSVVRHREQDLAGMTHHDEYYSPAKLRLDEAPERLVEGTTYEREFEQRKINLGTMEEVVELRHETWTVARFGEELTLPAGTYCTMQVRRETRVDGELGSDKQYWFARGVGKVKERSDTRREELLEAGSQ